MKFKQKSKILISSFLIVLFFLIVDWLNPSYEDALWPFAVIGAILSALFFLIGIVIIIYKVITDSKPNIFFYSLVGFFNIFFAISWVVLFTFKNYESVIFFFIIPVFTIGGYILVDIFWLKTGLQTKD